MLRPSTAPRWKIATRDLLARAGRIGRIERARQPGGRGPTPNIPSAELFRNNRRVVMKVISSGNRAIRAPGRPSAPASAPVAPALSRWNLESAASGSWNKTCRATAAGSFSNRARVHLRAGHAIVRQRQREIHAGQQRRGVDPFGIRAGIPGRLNLAIERLAQLRDLLWPEESRSPLARRSRARRSQPAPAAS